MDFFIHGFANIAGLGQVQGSSDLQDSFLESKVAVEVVEDFGKHFGGQNVTYISYTCNTCRYELWRYMVTCGDISQFHLYL